MIKLIYILRTPIKIYLQNINYKNIEEYNANKKRKILIVFDDIIADMLSNKKLNPTITELLLRGRKLNISRFFQFITKIIRPKQTNDSFKISDFIIHQALTFQTL